jgi:divalent metal cation (Fe/Co/Zn/Cd) transporter
MNAAMTMTTAQAKAATRQKVASLAFWSIVVAFVVLALKVVAWYITGSVALYSDAAESIVNVIASVAAFWAI